MKTILASELDDIFDDDDIIELNNNINLYSNDKTIINDCCIRMTSCNLTDNGYHHYSFELFDSETLDYILKFKFEKYNYIYPISFDISYAYFMFRKPKSFKILYNYKPIMSYTFNDITLKVWTENKYKSELFLGSYYCRMFVDNYKNLHDTKDLSKLFYYQMNDENEQQTIVQLQVDY